MSVLELSKKLIQRDGDVDTVLRELQSLKKPDIVNASQDREQILSNCVEFCDHCLHNGRHAPVVRLFTFIHVAISDDDWLPAAFNRLSPHLLQYYDMVLANIDTEQTTHLCNTPPNLFRLNKFDLNSLRLLSGIFELCVDFCDVVYAGDHLSGFVKPLIMLLCISDFQEASLVVTEVGYAKNELLRSASLALSNFVTSFTSLAAKAKEITEQQLEGLFKTLSNAPELSIQRSLTVVIRSLYDDAHVAEHIVHSELNAENLKQMIERKLSTTQFGSGKALAGFRELQLADENFLTNYENLIKVMFLRKRKALKCFSANPCVVEVKEVPAKRKRVIEAAYVEWNLNSVCVRDRMGIPVYNWPFFAVMQFDWMSGVTELSFIFEAFHGCPSTRVSVQLGRTLKRNDRKIIQERIDRILSMVPKDPTPRVNDPMLKPTNRLPVAVSVALNGKTKSTISQGLSEEFGTSYESEQYSDENRVGTALSGFQEDGVFLRKRTGSRAESVMNSHKSSSSSEKEEQTPPFHQDNESSAESTGVNDLFRDQQHVDVDDKQAPTSELSAFDNSIGFGSVSKVPAGGKAVARLQSSHSGPRILRSRFRHSENGGRNELCPVQEEQLQNKTRRLEGKHSQDVKTNGVSSHEDSDHEDQKDEMKDVESGSSHEKRSNSTLPAEEKAPTVEPKKLRPRRRISMGLPDTLVGDVKSISDRGLGVSSQDKDHSSSGSSEIVENSSESKPVSSRTTRKKDGPKETSDDTMEVNDNNNKSVGEKIDRLPKTSILSESPLTTGILEAKETPNYAYMLKEEDGLQDVTNENERMRQMLLRAIKRMLKCQVDKSQQMLIATKKEVKLLQNKKRETNQRLIKAFGSKVRKFGDEQKEKLKDYVSRQSTKISKARKRVRDLKLKLRLNLKQAMTLKLKMQRLIHQSSTQMKTIGAKVEDELAELVAQNKKREEQSKKSSLIRNLMNMLGNK